MILQSFIKKIENEILESEGEIACIERRVSRLKAKLRNPEKFFAEDEKKKAANGGEIKKKKSNLPQLKEKEALKELINVVPNTQDVPEPKEDKKSPWSLFT